MEQEINMEEVISTYLKYIDAPISIEKCKNNIYRHPDYPSIISIADVLEPMGIECIATKQNLINANDIPYPCLIHTLGNGGSFVFVKDEAEYLSTKNNIKNKSGITVKLKFDKVRKEERKDYIEYKFASSLKSILISLLIIGAICLVFTANSTLEILFLLLSISGVGVGIALIFKDLGMKYAGLENFCSTESGDGCDKILKSSGSLLFGVIRLSEVVLSYFLLQLILICCVLYTQHAELLLLSKFISFCALLAIPYSIYSQAVLRSWCKLCMIVNALLIGICTTSAFIPANISPISISRFLYPTIFTVCISVIIFSFIYLAVRQIKDHKICQEKLATASRVKHAIPVFAELLNSEASFSTNDNNTSLSIGHHDAPIILTMFSNLYCKPCKDKLSQISKLIDVFHDKIRAEFLFVEINPEGLNPTPNQYLLDYWIKNIRKTKNESTKTKELLVDWYELGSFQSFAAKYPLDSFSKEGELMYLRQLAKIDELHVLQTPTLYLNGYKIPDTYNFDDIAQMLPGLIEHFNQYSVNGITLVENAGVNAS
ncbi:MAG: vitamin K epoxide reductase family protein [Janthinobacterium lividum]